MGKKNRHTRKTISSHKYIEITWKGPNTIIDKVSPDDYKVKISCKIENIFHVAIAVRGYICIVYDIQTVETKYWLAWMFKGAIGSMS